MDEDVHGPLGVRIVVMAKAAVPGRVKTRLTKPGPGGEPALSPEAAAAVHAAMLDCVLTRAGRFFGGFKPRPRLRLAMDDPAAAPASAVGWEVLPQETGDLGERMLRVGGESGAVFLGVDSPDAPLHALEAAWWIAAGIKGQGSNLTLSAAGPVDDGGYWTLAVSRPLPTLHAGIDWGTAAVFEQTRAAAAAASLPFSTLPGWHDVDDAADLAALRTRLAGIDPAAEPELARLREALADPRTATV